MSALIHPQPPASLQRNIVKLEKDCDVMDISMEAACNGNWADLPKELLDRIRSHLYGEDVRSFHLVCRSWHATEEFVYQKEHNPLMYPEPQSQWLLHKKCSVLTYQFIHPVYPNVRYAVNLPEEEEKVNDEAIARHFKDGWLLMSSGKYSMFFFSPFPKKVIKLPDLIWPCGLDGATFTCAPTSSTGCCVVFAISCLLRTLVEIATIRLGKKRWKMNRYVNNILFRPSYCNPVFHKEVFYCLSKERNLGVYNHEEDTWTVLEKPQSPRKWADEHYLVEHEGGLISVFMGDSGSWVSIFKLNESDMVWENVHSLGDYALFVSIPTSFATNNVLDMMKNKIFFPLLHNNYPVFYSLETKTFRTYGSDLHENNLYRTEITELMETSWIEPRENCYQDEELDWLLKTNDEETDDEEPVWSVEIDEEESDEETDEETEEYETNDVSDEWTEDETSEGETSEDEKSEDEDYKTSDQDKSMPEKREADETNNGHEEYETSNHKSHKETGEIMDIADRRKGASPHLPNAQACPWLMFSHGKSNLIQTFYSISDNRCVKRMSSFLSGNIIHANSDGWAVITGTYAKDVSSLSCFLLNLTSMEKILLPSLEAIEYHACLLSSSPLKPNCLVAFISSMDDGEDRRSRIKFWRPNQENWVEVATEFRLDCFIMCEGIIYGYQAYLDRLVMVDVDDNKIQLKQEIKIPDLVLKGTLRYDEVFIESCGDIFLFVKYMLGFGKKTRTLQVYKLMKDKSTKKLDWIRTTDIGDRVFFVHNRLNGFSCSATQAGLKRNSIYFTGDGQDTHIYRYCPLENRFHRTLPCPDVTRRIMQICWVRIHQPFCPEL